MHAMKLSVCFRPNFFSITETADEYTLIVTEDDFRGKFPVFSFF